MKIATKNISRLSLHVSEVTFEYLVTLCAVIAQHFPSRLDLLPGTNTITQPVTEIVALVEFLSMTMR